MMSTIRFIQGLVSATFFLIAAFTPAGDEANKLLLMAICVAIWVIGDKE
jgi:hypothetical protein